MLRSDTLLWDKLKEKEEESDIYPFQMTFLPLSLRRLFHPGCRREYERETPSMESFSSSILLESRRILDGWVVIEWNRNRFA